MFKLNFPHIPRKITATIFWYSEKIGLWSALTAFLIANLYAKANFSPRYGPKVVTAIQNPSHMNAHVDLAETLRREGLNAAAQRELTFASSLKSTLPANSPVLGITTVDPEVILNNWKHEKANLQKDYAYWQSVIAEKSDYRDAYLKLAALAYQLSYSSEAKNYLSQALELDPNNPALIKFSEEINDDLRQ